MSADLYSRITETICAAIEAGTMPWVKPWTGSGPCADHHNAASGHAYRGLNVLLLNATAAARGHRDPRWVTFRQALALGGAVRRGESGTTVIFWSMVKAKEEGVERVRPLLRHYTVFNVAQCDGLDVAEPLPAPAPSDYAGRLRAIVDGLAADGCPVVEGIDRAAYSPSADRIVMPAPGAFRTSGAHAEILLHEATHATGHAKRLARDFGGRFGSASYAFEELVAHMGSAFLCGALAVGTQGVQHPEYIADWLRVLRGDRYAIFTAAREAERAAGWLLSRAGLAVDEDVSDEADVAAAA